MTNQNIDQELLHSFAVEAKNYLAEILNGVVEYHRHPERAERLDEAHRNAQTFKGAAAMVRLTPLSEAAIQLEEVFEEIAAGRVTLSSEAVVVMSEAISQINIYLGRVVEGSLEEHAEMADARDALLHLCRYSEPRPSAGVPPTIKPQPIKPQPIRAQTIKPQPVKPAPRTEPRRRPTGPLSQPPASRNPMPDVSTELLGVFLPEAEEHLKAMNLALLALSKQPNDKELMQNLRRRAHSLKGSAGMVGFQEIARLAHRMEDLMDLIYDGYLALTPDRLNLLFTSTDALENLTDGQIDQASLRAIYEAYDQLPGLESEDAAVQVEYEDEPSEPVVATPRSQTAKAVPPPVAVPSEPAPDETAISVASMLPTRSSFVRVPIEQLDELVKLVTELIITRTSFEQNLTELQDQLEELRTSSARLGRVSDKMETQFEASALGRGLRVPKPGVLNGSTPPPAPATSQPSEIARGFDELEFDRYTEFHILLRGLTETTNDVQTLDRELRMIRESLESCLSRQGKLSSEVQDKIMRLRMVPLSTLSSRLARTVRTVASQRGKSVHFLLDGEDTQLDKTVIEEMADPLLHFLRNAVDHGIESPAVRRALGKPATGTIWLRAYYEGTQIIIQIRDDGAGIDPERLRVAAVSGGYLSEQDAARIPVEDLFTLIFLPGFSTAPQVSEISGRGVGLDVASVAIHRLKGSVKVDSRPGEGASFTVRLPMTLAVMPALMVKVSLQTFAIPLVGIKQVMKIGPDQIEKVGKEPVVRIGGAIFPLLSLSKLLGLKRPEEKANDSRPVLFMSLEDRQVAVAVDETLAEREIVVKNLGNHLRQVHGVTGATLMGDGSVVLILNLAELIRDAFRPRNKPAVTPVMKRAAPPSRRSLSIMVIDDSVSVRRVLSNLISTAGWKPIQARDGLDAMEMLPHLPTPPDVVLLDIEMPRMDGYEFISAMRGQQAYERTPIIILTSRAGQKHRDKAFELGATDYVVKPYQDESLLALIRQLTTQQAPLQNLGTA
ncbi:MAG TPA: Hpt domain-containing protein [Blastocatellia bacterium]|nr:Hpt domain-containing protein [Blastocatellia bacterium]